jgi:hypothetical protein
MEIKQIESKINAKDAHFPAQEFPDIVGIEKWTTS